MIKNCSDNKTLSLDQQLLTARTEEFKQQLVTHDLLLTFLLLIKRKSLIDCFRDNRRREIKQVPECVAEPNLQSESFSTLSQAADGQWPLRLVGTVVFRDSQYTQSVQILLFSFLRFHLNYRLNGTRFLLLRYVSRGFKLTRLFSVIV